MTGPMRAMVPVVESGCGVGRPPRRRCRRWLVLLAVLLAAGPARARSGRPAVAFYYGRSVPVAELGHFDWVVVEPENLDARGLADLQAAGVQVFAYLSLGEAAPGTVDPSWVLGRNAGWGSAIVNPAAPGWRQQVLGRAHALWERGYRGLFLDTLDSHVSALPGAEARRSAGAALAGLVRAIHERHPDLKLFFNRGFEILDEVGPLACGLAAESLFFGWDAAAKRYVEVPEVDREWLAGRLRKARDRLRIPVVVVDYLPPTRREAAREAARRIEAMGFTPWISTPSLDALGVGSLEVVPRRVLLLYDGAEAPDLARSPIHRLAALPVEHLGCAADYLDVRRGLPQEPLAGRYAGIVTWFTDDDLPDAIGYAQWLARQIEAGVRVAMLARPGFAVPRSLLARLGLAAAPAAAPPKAARVVKRDGLVGLEAEPELRSRGLVAWHAAAPEVAVHLRLEDAQGQAIDPVLTAPWGGMALDPYLLATGHEGRARWIVDPFAFLEAALALPPAPALDLTTENGARLLVVVADGGSTRPAGRDATSAAEVILRQVLTAIPVATTVAIAADGPGTRRDGHAASRLEGLTRAILGLPGVELAARFSAPSGTGAALPEGTIEASLAHLRGLLPGGKALRALLWPEDGLAAPTPSASVEGLELVSLRRGGPEDGAGPSLTELQPSGRPAGDLFEVYLPGCAAGGWGGTALDLERQIELAERSEAPRRLQPIGLCYAFSMGTRAAALRSLQGALRWALAQGARPLWSSEYARRVRDFQSASVARALDGTWRFRGLGLLRTVRLPRALGWPDPARSRGVAGVAEVVPWRYVSLAPGEPPVLAFSQRPTPGPYLAWTNASLERWDRRDRGVSLRLRGHGPVRFTVAGNPGPCTLAVEGQTVRPQRAAGRDTFSLAQADTGEAALECPRD